LHSDDDETEDTTSSQERLLAPVYSYTCKHSTLAAKFQEVDTDTVNQLPDWLAVLGVTKDTPFNRSLSVLDLTTNSALCTFNLPGDPVVAALAPNASAMFAGHNRVCVCIDDVIRVYDVRSGTEVASVENVTSFPERVIHIRKAPRAGG
jgi:hypothetical protein